MTAHNVWTQGHAAHIVADAASYWPDGTIEGFQSKIVAFPDQKMAMVGQGRLSSTRILGHVVKAAPVTQRDVIELMPVILRTIVSENEAVFPGDPVNCACISAIAWDEATERAVVYSVGSGGDAVVGGDPYVRYRGKGTLSPPMDAAHLSFETMDPLEVGADILRAQRLWTSPQHSDCHVVGGYGEAISVTRDGLSLVSRIIEWPEDAIGQRIGGASTLHQPRRLFVSGGI